MDYKDTLNMPNTDFEMRGNLAQKEPGILKNWQQDNYYQNLLEHTILPWLGYAWIAN